MQGGVLDAGERLIDREHAGDALCAINTEAIPREAANKGQIKVSAAADTFAKSEHICQAHLMLWRVVFTASISASLEMPSVV